MEARRVPVSQRAFRFLQRLQALIVCRECYSQMYTLEWNVLWAYKTLQIHIQVKFSVVE